MYRNPSDREVTKKMKQPVSVNRLKKVVSASIESIRILSEIFMETPIKFLAAPANGTA